MIRFFHKRSFLIALLLIAAGLLAFAPGNDPRIVSYVVDPQKQQVQFFWKDADGHIYRNIGNLKTSLAASGRKLVFAMNGGMYKTDNSPLGLYIENGNTITRINRDTGYGNFYLEPNGVFYITKDNKAFIRRTKDFKTTTGIKYATQSGPMLLIDGKINPILKKGSANVNIRNAVGILPNNKILFAISTQEINFYGLAMYFESMGCKDALYLDGYVSKMYLRSQNIEQTTGDLGVLIGVTE